MSDIIPESGLGPQNSRWRQWLEQSITGLQNKFVSNKNDTVNAFKATNSSLQLLTKQVAQLNSSTTTADGVVAFAADSTPGSQAARTNYDAVSVSLTKPAWATRATVIVTASILSSGTAESPSQFTALYARIAGVNSGDQSRLGVAPVKSIIYSAGIPTSGEAYTDYYSTQGNFQYTRTFTLTQPTTVPPTPPITTVNCSVRLSKNFTGAGHAFTTTISATAFWFAT